MLDPTSLPPSRSFYFSFVAAPSRIEELEKEKRAAVKSIDEEAARKKKDAEEGTEKKFLIVVVVVFTLITVPITLPSTFSCPY